MGEIRVFGSCLGTEVKPVFTAEFYVSVWCNQVEPSSYSAKSPKSHLSQGAAVFIDCDNCGVQWRRRVQDSIGGPLVKFPSNQDSGFHKIIPVRAK